MQFDIAAVSEIRNASKASLSKLRSSPLSSKRLPADKTYHKANIGQIEKS